MFDRLNLPSSMLRSRVMHRQITHPCDAVQSCDGVDLIEALMACLYDLKQFFQRLRLCQLVIDLHMRPLAVQSAGVMW